MAARAAVYSCWVIWPACNTASSCESRVDKLGGGAGGVFCCVLPGRVAMNAWFRCSARRLISSSLSGRAGLGLEISVCAGAFHQGMMRSPDEVVTRFCALWSKPDLDEIASCFTEDAVYRNIPPTPSVEGREAIREFIAEFLATLDGIDFIVHRQISDHGVVMHERTDVLRRKDGVEISVPIMGVFEIADGKIATWRDYFDTAITSAFSS